MIDNKYKNMLISAAKAILGKPEAFQKGAEEAQNSMPKNNPYYNDIDVANYDNGYDTAEAANKELEEFLLEKQ